MFDLLEGKQIDFDGGVWSERQNLGIPVEKNKKEQS